METFLFDFWKVNVDLWFKLFQLVFKKCFRKKFGFIYFFMRLVTPLKNPYNPILLPIVSEQKFSSAIIQIYTFRECPYTSLFRLTIFKWKFSNLFWSRYFGFMWHFGIIKFDFKFIISVLENYYVLNSRQIGSSTKTFPPFLSHSCIIFL